MYATVADAPLEVELSEEFVELEEGSEVKHDHRNYQNIPANMNMILSTRILYHPHFEGGNPQVFLGCSSGSLHRLDKSRGRNFHWNRVDLPRKHF